jgi:hypothetical protein
VALRADRLRNVSPEVGVFVRCCGKLLKPGSYMFHPAKAVHWDGAKDEEVIVQITGIGPAPSRQARRQSVLFYQEVKPRQARRNAS